MRHIFIINPAAGKHDPTASLTAKIHAAMAGLDYEIYRSQQPGDCLTLARRAASSGEPVRIYACGGDGTLNEVVRGILGYPNAAVTVIPTGSGNDFVRCFSAPETFRNISCFRDCEETKLDLVQSGDDLAVNVCSIGFDARVGTEISRYKRLPFVTGSGAYVLSILVNVIRGIHAPYTVSIDGNRYSGRFTMICVCNGRYYGGGFNPVPTAELDDGLLDVLLVAPVSRFRIATVIGHYKHGEYRDFPHLIRHFQCKSVRISCQKPTSVNLDGELRIQQEVEFRLLPGQIRFFYPRGLTFHANEG
jgi:diacylglycerol kinase (ATP)